jgi:DNA helicase-2/ATP-dependent DNA helicase PcrA
MTNEEIVKLDILSAYIGSPLTDEQKEFAADFTRDTISFSDPGTGKTHTLIAGLIMAQTHHKIPGKTINCMSFTNAAVSEMAGRYRKLCEKCSVSPTVVFNTFHSLSNHIMKDAYPMMKISANSNIKQDVEDMTIYLQQAGINVTVDDTSYVRKVVRAINDLNSSLTFHPDNVATKFAFVELDMDIDIFQDLRKTWFMRGITTNQIVQGDIPLYCLYALMKKPDIIDKWKGKYKIMVVDEFQDLSLLHLQILSYVAQTLIVIGDMKQQIYAFNGACPQIVQEYLKLHPNAKVCNLTHSFRCGQEIADFATNLIKPNDQSINTFVGHDRGSNVRIVQRRDLDWKEIVANIEADRKLHGSNGARDVMFLYRNNASAIPIIDELYKKGIPYRCSKFAMIMSIPIFDSLSKLCNAAWQPNDPVVVNDALKLFPEFKNTMYGTEVFPVQAMRSSGKSIFDVSYKYKEESSYAILNAMILARRSIEENKSAGVVYMKVMEVYKKYIYKNEWWKVDNTEEFYFNLVAPICNSKTYPIMYNEELDKEQRNRKCIQANMGIRCYTMHSAKGLEADDVYILDCDEGVFPNAKIMQNKVNAGCELDVATDIRSERNLLYVAVTRAKDNVTISYSGAEPTKLITEPMCETYHKYDSVYENAQHDYDDAAEFFKLFRIEVN